MLIEQLIITLVVLLCLSLIAAPLARAVRLPYSSVLVVLGFVVSELVVAAGLDTGLRAHSFQTLIFYVFIPVLVFQSAFYIDKQQLIGNLLPILFLAVLGMLLTCGITAVLLFYGIGHPTGFPWIAALLTGAILAATDPVAVVARLKELHAPERLGVLLEGESLFNDATAIVLFSLFLSIAVAMAGAEGSAPPPDVPAIILRFCVVFFGGAFVGIAMGWLAGWLSRYFGSVETTLALMVMLAYGSFVITEHLHLSGVMGVLGAGLAMSMQCAKKGVDDSAVAIEQTWSFLAHVANAIVFLIVGAVITLSMFEQRWLAMLIAIAAVTLARACSIYGGMGLISLFQRQPVSFDQQRVMVWGGLRGAVTLALALSLPVSLPYWWTIQSIAFGVVLFTLFVQATTITGLVERTEQRGPG